MLEAVMLWNEPNNKSHWDFTIDTDWMRFSEMVILAAQAIKAENPRLPRVLGGMSPIDPLFVERMERQGVLAHVDAIGVHGFPLDWNHWQIQEWPAKLEEIRRVTNLPLWVSEVGVSAFGAEEVQAWGVRRTADLLKGRCSHVHWYSLFDLPKAWPATTRHREAEGSSYYRHFYMGLIREDGGRKPALTEFAKHTDWMGLCQWFHFRDHRLHDAATIMRELGVRYLRTGLSWSDSLREGSDTWFDEQMRALEEFRVTGTFCFTPESRGIEPHHTSPPKDPREFADFCARMVRRFAPGRMVTTVPEFAKVAPLSVVPACRTGAAAESSLVHSPQGRSEP